MKQISVLISIALLAVVSGFVSGLSTSHKEASTDNQETCHLREIDLCLSPIAVLTQNSNPNAVTTNEINNQCKMLVETEGCLKNYTIRCTTPNQAQLVDIIADGGLDTIRQLCNKTSNPLREKYLKHGTCINNQNKGQRLCMRQFQASIEKASDINWQDRLKLACCAYNKMHACVKDVIEPKCGRDAYELSQVFFRTSFSRLPQVSCAKYDHSSKACSSILPPPDTIPKGAKSHSALSKLLSMYTQTN